MFTKKQISQTGGDETAKYSVTFDGEYTVEKFAAEVLSNPNEWGTIHLYYNYNELKSVDYSKGILLEQIPSDINTLKIKAVTAHGGWSLMNYEVDIK